MQFVRKVLAITSFLVLLPSCTVIIDDTPEDEETMQYELGVWDTIPTQAPMSTSNAVAPGTHRVSVATVLGYKGQPKNLTTAGRATAAVRTARFLNVFASLFAARKFAGSIGRLSSKPLKMRNSTVGPWPMLAHCRF